MSYEWLRGHYQNNVYGYMSLNYKLNQNFDFQFRPSITTYDMLNSEKLPYSGVLMEENSVRVITGKTGDRYLNPMRICRARYHQNEIFGLLDVSALAG